MVPKVCFADPEGFVDIPQGIRGYSFIMATLKFIQFFNWRNNVLLKIIVKFFNW